MRPLTIFILLASSCPLLRAQSQAPSDLKSLCIAHQWTELQSAFTKSKGLDLYKGAFTVVFHQNLRRAELLLRAAIKNAPDSDEAYELLSHLYLYSGQYERLISTMEARWASFPQKADNNAKERA